MSAPADWQKYNFTHEERDVLFLAAEGRKSSEIAYKLKMTLKLVEEIRRSLLRKMEATSFPQLIRKAMSE